VHEGNTLTDNLRVLRTLREGQSPQTPLELITLWSRPSSMYYNGGLRPMEKAFLSSYPKTLDKGTIVEETLPKMANPNQNGQKS
jgi:hypothetical protein